MIRQPERTEPLRSGGRAARAGLLRTGSHAGIRLALFLLGLWALLALWYHDPVPQWIRAPGAVFWGILVTVCLTRLRLRTATSILATGALLVGILSAFNDPSNDRDWSPDQARIPTVTVAGDKVSIGNMRHATYLDEEDYTVHWYEREYDLGSIRSVDYVVEPFSSWRGLAHTFLTFGFADGEHVAISVEIRKEARETFSPIKGLFKQFELMYVIGDERDLIGLRTNIRHDPVYLFPIKATREQARGLFLSMLQRADSLSREPEFYNSLTNTCTTNIVRHLEELTGQALPLDLGVVFPGYSDAFAHELGLIEFDGSLEAARKRFLINERSSLVPDGPDWSRQIRDAAKPPPQSPAGH